MNRKRKMPDREATTGTTMEADVRVPGLRRKVNVFVYRRKVPADLPAHYGGKRELVVPLFRAEDSKVTASRALAAAARIEAEFVRFRMSIRKSSSCASW
jgi:hypothetical protein